MPTARYPLAMRALPAALLSALCAPVLAAEVEGEPPEDAPRPKTHAIDTPASPEVAQGSSSTTEWRATAETVAPLLRACLAAEGPRTEEREPTRAEVRLKLTVDGEVAWSRVRIDGGEISPDAEACAANALAPLRFPPNHEPVVVAYTLEVPPPPRPVRAGRPRWLTSLALGGLCGPTAEEAP